MLKVLEGFSGIGAQTQALKNIGIEHTSCQCEIDKYAVQTYNMIHGNTPNLGDITKVDVDTLKEGQFDLFTYSFPCFVADTLVDTAQGLKPIIEVEVGDKVLTHNGIYKTVLNKYDNGKHKVIKLRAMGFEEIICTPNHKFLVREKYYKYVSGNRRSKEGWKKKDRVRCFSDAKWVEADEIKVGHYFGFPINRESKIPIWDGIDFVWRDGRKARHKNEISKYLENETFWWLIGRYVADGWQRKREHSQGIVIACGKKKIAAFKEKMDILKMKYNIAEERTAFKFHFLSKELRKFVMPIGEGASNKEIPKFILDLPKYLLESFLDGYMSGDGHVDGVMYKANSVSKKLMYGIGQCVAKVYHRPFSLYKTKRKETTIIEGRLVHQKDSYCISWKKEKNKQDKAFYDNGYIWFPFIEKTNFGEERVYDIEVEEDHSFVAQNAIAHNCQSVSIAGKQEGLAKGSGTESSLLWECEKIIRKVKPKYLLMENVAALVSDKFMPYFQKWLDTLDDLGYTNYWQILNAKNYGIPQNRERVFCVSILGTHYPYQFPQPVPLKLRLKDMLEKDVEEKYYLSDKMVTFLVKNNDKQKERGNGFRFLPQKSEQAEICNSITTQCGGRPTDTFIEQEHPDLQQVGTLDIKGQDSIKRVYSPNGISPTITTCEGGNRQPKIQEEQGIEVVGMLDNKNFDMHRRVYSPNGNCPCITAHGADHVHKIIEEDKPQERFFQQAFETLAENDCDAGDTIDAYNKKVNKTGVCPTITTRPEGFKTAILPVVENKKEEEPKIDRIGGLYGQATRWGVYNKEGISPTIVASMGMGGGHVPMVEEPMICASRGRYTEQGTTEQQLELNKEGTSNTITTVEKDNYVLEPKITIDKEVKPSVAKNFEREKEEILKSDKEIYQAQCDSGWQDNKIGLKVSPTIRANNSDTFALDKQYRIRKLTPRECFRLMGFKDEQFDKIKDVSNAQLYKQAGNSIVVNVLEAIFRQLFLADHTGQKQIEHTKTFKQMDLF